MKRIYRIVRWAVALFFLSSVLVTLLYRWVNVPLTPLMAIRCMQQAGRGEQVRLHYKWVPLSEMSCYLPVAVIASEDQNFLVHHGFDTQAIGAAMRERMSGGRMRGGSNERTLSALQVTSRATKVELCHTLCAIHSIAHLDDVEIDLHDAFFRPKGFDQEGEVDFKALTHPR